MRAATRDLLTGITAVVGLAGLVLMLFLFGELKDITRSRYQFTLRMDSARGLAPVSPVTMNGVPIGTVAEIRTGADPTEGVDVRLSINEGVRIPRRFTVYIDRGFVGDSTLELAPDPDQPLHADAYVRPGEVIVRNGLGTFEQIAQRLERPLEALNRSAANFDELASTYTEVGRRVNSLLEPRTPADVDGGRPATIPSTVARLDSALANANAWLGDAELRTDAHEIVRRVQTALDTANQTAAAWQQAATDVRELSASAREQLRTASAQLVTTLRTADEALANFRQIAAAINEGRGTAGMLVHNPDLYESLDDAAQRLERMLTEAQLAIEKFRKEGVPIQY